MKAERIGSGDWVVVCDGRKALILSNKGDEKFPNLQIHCSFEHGNHRTRELGADAPGRAQESAGMRRSAVRQTDWHDAAENEFLRHLAQKVDQALLAPNAPKSLFMVASPRALGMIRNHYTAAIRRAMKAEIGKDYVSLPVHEIEKHLSIDIPHVERA